MFASVLLNIMFALVSCSEFQDKVFRNLLRLCHEQYVPIDNSTAVYHTPEIASCCTGNCYLLLYRLVLSLLVLVISRKSQRFLVKCIVYVVRTSVCLSNYEIKSKGRNYLK